MEGKLEAGNSTRLGTSANAGLQIIERLRISQPSGDELVFDRVVPDSDQLRRRSEDRQQEVRVVEATVSMRMEEVVDETLNVGRSVRGGDGHLSAVDIASKRDADVGVQNYRLQHRGWSRSVPFFGKRNP